MSTIIFNTPKCAFYYCMISFCKPPAINFWMVSLSHKPTHLHLTPICPGAPWLTCDISLPLIGALLIWVGRRHALGWIFSLHASRHGPWQPFSPYTVQLRPYAHPSNPTTTYCCRGDDGRAGLGRSHPCLTGVELPVNSLITPRALLVQSVIAGVSCVRCSRHQARAGEVCVGQELGLLVQGERGLLVGRLQIGSWDPWVRVPHATPDGAAGMGAPHAAAGWLIHGDAKTLHTLLNSVLLQVFFLVEELKTLLRRKVKVGNQYLCHSWEISSSAD